MQRSKVRSYLGFALRAGKLTLGVNAAETLKKGVRLLIADSSVAKNSFKVICKLKDRFACPLLFAKDLGELAEKPGCKLAAVRDESLAKAILAQAEEEGLTAEEPLEGDKESDVKE